MSKLVIVIIIAFLIGFFKPAILRMWRERRKMGNIETGGKGNHAEN